MALRNGSAVVGEPSGATLRSVAAPHRSPPARLREKKKDKKMIRAVKPHGKLRSFNLHPANVPGPA